MNKFIAYIKDSYPVSLGALAIIIGVFYFAGIESAKAGDFLPLIIISGLFIIYIILFAIDFKKYKSIQK